MKPALPANTSPSNESAHELNVGTADTAPARSSSFTVMVALAGVLLNENYRQSVQQEIDSSAANALRLVQMRFEDAIDVWRNHAMRVADGNDGVILAATAGAIGVRLGGASLRPLSADAVGQPLSAPGAAAGEGLPGVAARTAHLTQVVGLVWRTVALWLLLLAIGGYVWIDLARVVRSEAARLREAPFVLAARAAGARFDQVMGLLRRWL